MNNKEMHKKGYEKKTVYMVKSRDINGKEHFLIYESIKDVKELENYDTQVNPVSMIVKKS